MENTIYYTFSTIAQVLAAIVGITGAFAMFRFQSIKDSLFGMAQDFLKAASFLDNTMDPDDPNRPFYLRLKTNIDYRKIDDLEPAMHDIVQHVHTLEPAHRYQRFLDKFLNIKTRYDELTTNSENKAEQLKKVLIVGLSIITASIIVLAFTTLICVPLAYLLLASTIISTAYCFNLVYKFISSSIH